MLYNLPYHENKKICILVLSTVPWELEGLYSCTLYSTLRTIRFVFLYIYPTLSTRRFASLYRESISGSAWTPTVNPSRRFSTALPISRRMLLTSLNRYQCSNIQFETLLVMKLLNFYLQIVLYKLFKKLTEFLPQTLIL